MRQGSVGNNRLNPKSRRGLKGTPTNSNNETPTSVVSFDKGTPKRTYGSPSTNKRSGYNAAGQSPGEQTSSYFQPNLDEYEVKQNLNNFYPTSQSPNVNTGGQFFKDIPIPSSNIFYARGTPRDEGTDRSNVSSVNTGVVSGITGTPQQFETNDDDFEI